MLECMKKNNPKIISFFEQWGWYILFFTIIVFWHVIMRENPEKDALRYFAPPFAQHSLLWLLNKRFYTWTSRLFLEAFLYPLAGHVGLWKVCNVAVFALFVLSLLRLTHYRAVKFTLGLCLMYPFREMASAGWIATCVNYLWPLAFGTYALIGLDKVYQKERIYRWEWLTFGIAALFATNAEQVCLIFLCVLFWVGIDHYIIKGERNGLRFYALLFLITVSNLILHLSAPGNWARYWISIMAMEDYETLSFVDKGCMGIISTVREMVRGNPIWLFFVLSIFVISASSGNCKRMHDRAMNLSTRAAAAAPFMFTMLWCFFSACGAENVFRKFIKIDAQNWNNLRVYLPFIMGTLIIIAIVFTLLNLFDDARQNLELTALFLTGLLSRLVMGFSPVSTFTPRTFIFFNFSLVFVLVRMFDYGNVKLKRLPSWVQKAGVYVFVLLVAFSLIRNTARICRI